MKLLRLITIILWICIIVFQIQIIRQNRYQIDLRLKELKCLEHGKIYAYDDLCMDYKDLTSNK